MPSRASLSASASPATSCLATPTNASGSKRKRNGTVSDQPSGSRRRTLEPEQSFEGQSEEEEPTADEDDSDDDEHHHNFATQVDDEPDDLTDQADRYDPDQPLEERRQVQRGFRNLMQDLADNSEEYLQSGSRGINETILKANEYLKKVRRPGEAASDSRLLVSTTDLSYRKTVRLTQGSLAQGVDVDEFVSKCITYMRQGRGIADDDAPELSSTQRHRRRSTRPPGGGGGDADADADDVGDEGDTMNWPHLGRFAALPHIRRPGLPGFMLGPLSVEKKARKVTKRSAPFRPQNLSETRPEVLDVTDFAKKENDLTAICGSILQRLRTVQADVQTAVADILEDMPDDEDDDAKLEVMHAHGLRSTGGIDVMRFVVNPRSFGQTVENMFYVSFLIRDGKIEIDYDENDLPALAPVDLEDEDEDDNPRARSGASKHQAILSMDMETWQDIIDTFGLGDKEPMIAHRREASAASGPGAKGWYS